MKYRFLFILALTMLLSSCIKEDMIFLPDGGWEMTYIPVGYDRTTLHFCGDEVEVIGDNPFIRPFEEGIWDYYITSDGSQMHISRGYYDFDGEYASESYTFDLTLSDDGRKMELYYDPFIGRSRTILFHKI